MFEYTIKRSDGFVSVEDLNDMGFHRWELVSIVPDENGYDYIFKRFTGSNVITKVDYGVPSDEYVLNVINSGVDHGNKI